MSQVAVGYHVPMNSPETMSRWPFRAAFSVALAIVPLIWAGGLVTTTRAGMAVPDWPGTFGYNLWLYPWTTWFFGPWDLFIEHGHRLLGTLVGLLSIGFVFAAFRCRTSPLVRWGSVALLLAIIGQGVLGGLRVVMSEQTLAMIHGTTGPAVFALSVLTVAIATKRWQQSAGFLTSRRVAWLATVLLLATYCQIALGAWLRHIPIDASPRVFTLSGYLHVALATGIVGGLITVALWARKDHAAVSRETKLGLLIVIAQFALGLATWRARYGIPYELTSWIGVPEQPIIANGIWQTMIVTGHQATGSLLLATLVWMTAFAWRTAQSQPHQVSQNSRIAFAESLPA